MSARPPKKPQWQRPIWRIVAVVGVMVVALAGLIARLIVVQVLDGSHYRAQAVANQVRLIPVAAPRGTIYDRHGRVLARSRPSFVVALIPSQVHDPDAEVSAVAGAIGVDVALLRKRMLHHRGLNYQTFSQLAGSEPYGPVVLADALPVAAVARLSELLSDLPGVDLEVQPRRDYPYGPLGSHLFGYVGAIAEDEYERRKRDGYSPNDVVGKDGLEYQYDRYLRGIPGGQRVRVDAGGAVVATLSSQAAISGDALTTNLDWHLQEIAERALSDQIRKWGGGRPLSGAVVIEDPWTGGILALVSYPNFNPQYFADGRAAKIAYALTSPTQPLFDRAIAAATPTGSTFKMVTGSAALTEGVVKADQVIYDSGGWDCGGYYARDIASGGLGNTTFVPALAASSDGYFFRLAWWLGNARLRKYALDFGLAATTGIDLPGESEGNWPTNAWSLKVFGVPMERGDACFLGIGQGAMQATPLQMVNVASAVINGGTLYVPQVARSIVGPDGRTIAKFDPRVIRHVSVTPESLAAVRAGMARVTDPGGTAYGLAIDGLRYSGKTGTAETGGGSGPNTTWFVAWAPSDRPKLAIAVFVDRSGGYGAQVAAPVAREILVRAFNKKP